MENNSTLEKVLLVCNRNRQILWLVGATFQSGFSQKVEEEKCENSEKFVIFCFIYLLLLTFELSNIIWKCTENCNMLTERTYGSAVFFSIL